MTSGELRAITGLVPAVAEVVFRLGDRVYTVIPQVFHPKEFDPVKQRDVSAGVPVLTLHLKEIR